MSDVTAEVMVSVTTAAHLLRVSPSTIRRWVNAGELAMTEHHVSLEAAGELMEARKRSKIKHRLLTKYGAGWLT